MSTTQRERHATKSAEERAARLQQVSANQREGLATESAEERAVRLQQVSANQRERLATESAEEREARLLHIRANQRERRAAESSSLTHATIEEPFKQCSVQLKMRKFHEHFASLSSPKCIQCMLNSDHFYSIPLLEDDKLLCKLRLAPKMSCIRLVI